MKTSSVNKRKLIGQLNIYRSVLILPVICVFTTILSPSFSSMASLFSVSKQITVAGIVGCGTTFIILTGGIDLSVGSILGLAGTLASDILESIGDTGAAILVVLAVDIGCGAVNGLFVVVCEIPPPIFTPDMMALPRGCVLVYTKGSPIPIKVDTHEFLGEGTVAGVPVPVTIPITLFLITYYVLVQISYDRSVYVSGGNREVAHLSDISVHFTGWIACTLNGLMYGVADVILTARLGLTRSTSGTGIETDAIAAVILGGTSLNGGVDFVLPTVVDAMIMGITGNIPTLMNINPHATDIVKGVAMLIAVLVDKKVKDLSAKAE